MNINRGIIVVTMLFIMIIAQSGALAKNYVVDNISQSTHWRRAEWLNCPATPPDCTPCTPQTAMRMAKAGDTVYFRGGRGKL